MMRPINLAERLAEDISEGGSLETVAWEIIDLKNSGVLELSKIEPGEFKEIREKAFFLAFIKYLAGQTGQPLPEWAEERIRLEKPWIMTKLDIFKHLALRDAPLVFKDANIFMNPGFFDRA